MYILMAIIFIIVGIVMLVSPKTIFQITESWKGTGGNEPSALYSASTRVGGCILLIVGIACLVASFLHLI